MKETHSLDLDEFCFFCSSHFEKKEFFSSEKFGRCSLAQKISAIKKKLFTLVKRDKNLYFLPLIPSENSAYKKSEFITVKRGKNILLSCFFPNNLPRYFFFPGKV